MDLGWSGDLLWPLKWHRVNGVPVPSLGLKKLYVFFWPFLETYPTAMKTNRLECWRKRYEVPQPKASHVLETELP